MAVGEEQFASRRGKQENAAQPLDILARARLTITRGGGQVGRGLRLVLKWMGQRVRKDGGRGRFGEGPKTGLIRAVDF